MEIQLPTTGDRSATRGDLLSRVLCGATFTVAILCALAALAPGLVASSTQPSWSPLSTAPCYVLLLSLLTATIARGRNDARRAEETRFWTDLATGTGLAAAAAILAAFGGDSGAGALSVEALSAAAAAAWMLASARQPDLRHRWRVPKLERALAKPQVALLVAGLFLYFIVLPAPIWPPAGKAPDPRFVLGLSGFLAFRWALLWHSTRTRRFVGIYGCLALANALLVVQAWLQIIAPTSGDDPAGAAPRAAWGLLAGAFVVIAVHVRGKTPNRIRLSLWEKIQRAEGSLGPFEQTLLAALTFPTLHFLAYELSFFPPDRRSLHDILVLLWLALLAALAAWQHEIWQRRTQTLNEERQQAARSLRQIQKELLLNQDRFTQSNEPPGADRELAQVDFSAVFAACPEMIAVNRMPDGRYLEVNQAAERLLGYSPDELRDRTPEDLGIWVRKRERRELLRQLRDHGSVQDLEVTLRQRGGAEVLARVAATEIKLDGEACVVTVLREGLPVEKTANRLEDVPSRPGTRPD